MNGVSLETREALAGISAGRAEALAEVLGQRELPAAACGIDEHTRALVRIATLIALDAPPASYAWQVSAAVEADVTAEEILGVLRAVAPQVGTPRVIAAAAEVLVALGLPLSEGAEH